MTQERPSPPGHPAGVVPTTPVPLACANCGAPLEEEALSHEQRLARCAYCRSVLDLLGGRRQPEPEMPCRPEVPLPPYFTIRGGADRLEIVKTWLTGRVFLITALALGWSALVARHYWKALHAESIRFLDVVVPVPHAFVACVLLYSALAHYVNETRIVATLDSLRVQHGPLPWRGNVRIPAASVRQLYCIEKRAKSPTYEVRALTTDGRRPKLIGGFGDLDQALFVEQELERHLGIRDEPVAGELPRVSHRG